MLTRQKPKKATITQNWVTGDVKVLNAVGSTPLFHDFFGKTSFIRNPLPFGHWPFTINWPLSSVQGATMFSFWCLHLVTFRCDAFKRH